MELSRRGDRATVLSAGSDGIDGKSDAAGAVCDEPTLDRAIAAGLSVEQALQAYDVAPLLERIGDQIRTGQTGNNQRDLRPVLRDTSIN